jgi:cell division protease FtsH
MRPDLCMHRALAAAVTAAPLLGSVRPAAADDQQGVASSRMSYSRFLEYLDMGRVKKVSLLADCTLTRMMLSGNCTHGGCTVCATLPFSALMHDVSPFQQVDLYENGTIAIVEAVSPELGNRVQRVRVQLPGTSSELLNKFRDKKVDFAAHSNTEDGGAVFLNLLGEHACQVFSRVGYWIADIRCLDADVELFTMMRLY